MSKYALSDGELVSQYRNGNEEAFEELVKRHKNKLFTKILLVVKDRYIAEDLLQEVFIKVVNKVKSGTYNEEGKFLPWVYRISHNLAIDHFRKAKRNPQIVSEDGTNIFDTLQFSVQPFESDVVEKELKKKLRAIISELPETQREVLVMRHYMKMSFQEIAEATNVSINTALGRMRYALINLRKTMIKYNKAYDQNFYP